MTVPTHSAIVPLGVADVGPEDIQWLQKALCPERDGYAVDDILALASQNRCRIWRVVGEARGIFVTQLNANPAGIECVVWYLAGRGLNRAKDSIFEQLQVYAKSQGARWLNCWVSRPGLIKLYQKTLGFEYVATALRKEL